MPAERSFHQPARNQSFQQEFLELAELGFILMLQLCDILENLFARLRLSLMARAEQLLVDHNPSSEGEAFNEASFTSPALSPKMARSKFFFRSMDRSLLSE